MGLYNAELFNNLGLCCFFAQQFDMVITCFERALGLAITENAADVWYNIAHVAIVSIFIFFNNEAFKQNFHFNPQFEERKKITRLSK